MKIRELMPRDRFFNIPVRQADLSNSLTVLQDEVNRLFDRFYNGAMVHMTDWDKKTPAAPAVEIIENGKSYSVRFELAGMTPEDVELEIAGGTLVIQGEKKEEKKEEKDHILHQEIAYGSFYRSIPLPETVDAAKAEATFRNGVLSVEIPKKAEAVATSKKLPIKKAA